MSGTIGRPEWAQDRADILRNMWPDHSAAQIAKRLGITRNAVIGKANRLALPAKVVGQKRKRGRVALKPGPITLRNFEKPESL
jgi:GcrA cell cycle regulator